MTSRGPEGSEWSANEELTLMDQQETDRNLFGGRAVELDRIDPDGLVGAGSAGAARRDVPRFDLLRTHGWITPGGRAHPAGFLRRDLAQQGGAAHEAPTEVASDCARAPD